MDFDSHNGLWLTWWIVNNIRVWNMGVVNNTYYGLWLTLGDTGTRTRGAERHEVLVFNNVKTDPARESLVWPLRNSAKRTAPFVCRLYTQFLLSVVCLKSPETNSEPSTVGNIKTCTFGSVSFFGHLKVNNPINLGAKWKVLTSSFQICPWV